jgi:hypothetical protein
MKQCSGGWVGVHDKLVAYDNFFHGFKGRDAFKVSCSQRFESPTIGVGRVAMPSGTS